jgi:hypothetical protein
MYRDKGSHALPVFSPDVLTLTFYAIDQDDDAALVLFDLDTGTRRTVATEVDQYRCGGTPHPE